MSKEIHIEFKRPFPPGLNGKDGLIRIHWAKRKKVKDSIMMGIRSQTRTRFADQVRVEMKLYTCHLMDWDNYCAMLKLIGDALKDLGIIQEDNPNIIREFLPTQQKVSKKKNELLVIKIIEL